MPCRHHDVQIFDGLRCCLACGEAVFDNTPEPIFSPSHGGSVPYEYAPLNYALGQEIRLVIIFPGTPSDDVHLDIVHINLRDDPAYEAVSYAWATQKGDASLSQTVYCRGRTIAITKSCEAALKCFRRQGRNRTLWIDAISIDQTNIPERSHQVSFMGPIYSNASQVLVYLGPGTKATDIILDYLNDEATALIRPGTITGRSYIKGLKDVVSEVLRLRWFDRVWVLQEIALAKLATVTAGRKTVRWTHDDCITTLLRMCRSMDIEPPSALHWLPASEPHDDILTVLHKSRNCSSTDPRDKVFAVLGLADKHYQEALPVDYSLTAEEVFMKLSVYLIENERSLAVLKHVTGQIEIPEGHTLPNWVPRWDVKVEYDPLPPQFNPRELEMLASTWFTYKYLSDGRITNTNDLESLYELAKPTALDEPIWSTDRWRQWLAESAQTPSLAGIEAMALSLSQRQAQTFQFSIVPRTTRTHYHNPVAPQVEAFNAPKWPCLRVRAHRLDTITQCLGRHSGMASHILLGTLALLFSQNRLCNSCESHYVATPICQQNPSVAETIKEDFLRETRGRGQRKTMFLGRQSVGFAEVITDKNDSVWALDGADVPFVLRKVMDHYVLVGECYLYRALQSHPCICCGWDIEPWTISTEVIDIY